LFKTSRFLLILFVFFNKLLGLLGQNIKIKVSYE